MKLPILLASLTALVSLSLGVPAPAVERKTIDLVARAPAPPVGAQLTDTAVDLGKRGRHDYDYDGGKDGYWGKYKGGYGDRDKRCYRRYHHDGYGKCYPNYGHGGCRFGEYRGRRGYCSRHRYEDDDYYGGFKKGFPHRNWKYDDDSGHGYSYDHDGNGPPDWCPDGWQYYGRDIGWAPYKGWQPPHNWKPPVVFLKVIVKITWWSPPKDWCDYWQNKWEWYDYKIPSWWDFSPSKGGYKA
ncbi:hypothetical protein JCM10207_004533 [Rhodosporidiobolus poonsookiae]